jgi:hypothetical protein
MDGPFLVFKVANSSPRPLIGRFSDDYDVYVTNLHRWSDAAAPDDASGPDRGSCLPDLKAEVELGSVRAVGMWDTPAIPAGPRPDPWTWVAIPERKGVFRLWVYAGDVSARLERKVALIRGEGCDRDLKLP